MNVVCPQCETTFAFPDEMYNPGRKVRCTVCKLVFPLPDKATFILEEEPEQEAPKKTGIKKFLSFFSSVKLPSVKLPSIKISGAGKSKKLLIVALAVVSLCLIAFAGYMTYQLLSPADKPVEEQLTPEQEAAVQEQHERVKNIRLSDVRQFYVANEKLKKDILVIQGVATNEFATPRSFIEVEAVLLDESNKALIAKKQMAGPTLSSLQLQVFGEKDFKEVLTNRLSIVMANRDVAPGKNVHFMIIFTNVPKAVSSFEVRPINAIELDDSDKVETKTSSKP